jgi:hypothetical protein
MQRYVRLVADHPAVVSRYEVGVADARANAHPAIRQRIDPVEPGRRLTSISRFGLTIPPFIKSIRSVPAAK